MHCFFRLSTFSVCVPLKALSGHPRLSVRFLDPIDSEPLTPAQFEHRQVEFADVQKETKCSICLETFTGGERVCRLPCKHIFYDNCVSEWLKREAICPICRKKLRQQLTPPRDELPSKHSNTHLPMIFRSLLDLRMAVDSFEIAVGSCDVS
jgi:hypothetical protein